MYRALCCRGVSLARCSLSCAVRDVVDIGRGTDAVEEEEDEEVVVEGEGDTLTEVLFVFWCCLRGCCPAGLAPDRVAGVAISTVLPRLAAVWTELLEAVVSGTAP